MSIIVKDPMDGHFKLFIKGADSVIEARLDPDNNDADMVRHARDFALRSSKLGLRTLYIAMKLLDHQEVKDFFERVEEAENCIAEREELLEKIYSEFEDHLVLLGATAVEDKLQSKVIETIQDLKRANIKVWMLTGDKFETAENIAASCKLIDPMEERLEVIRFHNAEDIERFFCFDLSVD